MNVTDKWMLEQMQQMAAGLSALPQTDQNSQPPKTEKGESFKDLMDKALFSPGRPPSWGPPPAYP